MYAYAKKRVSKQRSRFLKSRCESKHIQGQPFIRGEAQKNKQLFNFLNGRHHVTVSIGS